MKTKFEIKIYTTPGCEACNIMKRLVSQAVIDNNITPVSIEEIGTDKEGLHRQRSLMINDFPTTVLYKQVGDKNLPMFELVGTKPVIEIRKLILKYVE